jgi:hypothetical protein
MAATVERSYSSACVQNEPAKPLEPTPNISKNVLLLFADHSGNGGCTKIEVERQ